MNPRKTLAAALPLPIEAAGLEVHPMTLGRWAALERIGSPLVTGERPRDSLELVPSLYLITHDPREVFRGNIVDAAMQWADTLPVEALEAILAAARRQMAAVFGVVPEADPKKAMGAGTTAGFPRSSTSPRRNTAGATG